MCNIITTPTTNFSVTECVYTFCFDILHCVRTPNKVTIHLNYQPTCIYQHSCSLHAMDGVKESSSIVSPNGDGAVKSPPSLSSAAPPGSVLTFADFPVWFEETFSANLSCELHAIRALLTAIREHVHAMQVASDTLRALYTNAPVSPQMTRILKLCDQIDSLSSQYGQEIPKLPGSSYLQDFSHKLRNRLKNVDDMASSSKLVRTDAAIVSSTSLFRSLIQQIVTTIELLEDRQRQLSIVTDYIDYVHLHVLGPIANLVQQNSSLSANQDTQQILSAAKEVSDAEASYRQMCTGDIFVKNMTLKKEAVAIQEAIDDMLAPLREIVKNRKVTDEFSKMSGTSWHRSLVNMLSCPIDEMLKHCRFR